MTGNWQWVGEGQGFHAPSDVDNIPEFDPRTGEHFWIVTTAYHVDPTEWTADAPPRLSYENLAMLAGPGCFYCERPYRHVKDRRCKGKP